MKQNNFNDCIYRDKMSKWLKTMDFKAMLTVKYYNKQGDRECLLQLSKIFRNFNQRIYGKNYKENIRFMNAVVAFEPDNILSNNRFHNHILIPNDYKTCKYDIHQLFDIAVKSSSKIRDKYGKIAFDHCDRDIKYSNGVSGIYSGCFQIVETYSEVAVNYITKKVKADSANVKFMDVNGLTDNDLSFLNQTLH